MPNFFSKVVLSFLIWSSHVGSFGVSSSCIPPTGLEDLPSGIADGITAVLAGEELPYLWLPQAQPFIGEVVKYEAPVQFRLAQIHGSRVYNVAAKYHPAALDIWGQDTHRICQDGESEYLNLHEEVALAYAFYYSAIVLIPPSEDIMKPIFESMGLPASFLDFGNPDPSTPWGLAKIAVDEMAAFVEDDGWNADGKLTTEFNPLPYSDFSIVGDNGAAYNPYVVETERNDDNWPWQPLVDSDGRGFFSKQEHVTPFIGYTARLYGMDEAHYQSFSAPPPEYNYEEEAEEVLERTRIMASSDLQKMMIEYYDSKFTSILPLQINWSIASGASEFEFWFNDMVLVNTMYDAILLVWKEKIAHNAVRPTTVVHGLFDDEVFDTYAGPFMGSNEIKAREWQPYVRTMPHAEYPAGSACVCMAFAETLQQLTGTDEIGFDLTQLFEAGSSRTEKGVTPSENITLVYNKWSDIAYDCGQSRLYGGMHFEASVSAANDLCSGFINPVVQNARLLEEGDSNGALARFPTTSPTSSPTIIPSKIPTSLPSKAPTPAIVTASPVTPNPNCKAYSNDCSATNPCQSGHCCSQWGYCGNSEAHCGECCQSGQCWNSQPSTSTPTPPTRHDPPTPRSPTCKARSNNCSATNPCQSGHCCSQWGYCGNSEAHCGECCQSGQCWNTQPSPPTPTPPDPPAPRPPTCKENSNQCSATNPCQSGHCCSQWGYCGNSEAHCGRCCQGGTCLA